MKRNAVVLLLVPVLILCVAAWAQDPPEAAAIERPTTDVPLAQCAQEGCHASVKAHKVVHGPVNVDSCDACHTLVDPVQHTFKDARTKREQCTFCHVIEIEDAGVVHQPLLEGDCVSCHDPHGGTDRSFVRGPTMAKLCATCHQDVIGNNAHVHGPVAAGACAACHEPHASEHPNLLSTTGRDLCLSCHVEMGDQLDDVAFVHEPVATGDCMLCHDAHASNFAMMIRDDPLKLCTEACHEDVRNAVFAAEHKHAAVTDGAACVNCHTAHGSDLDALMKDTPVRICLSCHDKPIETEGRTIPAVGDILALELVKHGPVRDGSCGGCHNVHGSDETRLLTKPYAEKFYTRFELKEYDLCFECHDKQLVLLENTEGLTRFRNGVVNLHYMHVNKVKRGRTCRACHSTHASRHPVIVRDSVPYGQWELPINYEPTDTGGSCTPGCHQKFDYDREEAIDNEETADAPQE